MIAQLERSYKQNGPRNWWIGEGINYQTVIEEEIYGRSSDNILNKYKTQ